MLKSLVYECQMYEKTSYMSDEPIRAKNGLVVRGSELGLGLGLN